MRSRKTCRIGNILCLFIAYFLCYGLVVWAGKVFAALKKVGAKKALIGIISPERDQARRAVGWLWRVIKGEYQIDRKRYWYEAKRLKKSTKNLPLLNCHKPRNTSRYWSCWCFVHFLLRAVSNSGGSKAPLQDEWNQWGIKGKLIR